MKLEIQFSSHLFWAYFTIVGLQLGVVLGAVATVRPTASSSSSPTKPPPVTSAPYVRKSREISPTSAPESMDPSQEQFLGLPSSSSIHFQYPSFKHKYQTRMARFHGGGGSENSHGGPATRTYSIRSMTSFPKLSPLASIMNAKSGEVMMRHSNPSAEELLEDESQDPTFTPFISARALSNIPQFFQHLRDNLEALQFDDDDEEEENEEQERAVERLLGQSGDRMYLHGNDEILNIPRPPEKPMRWMPVTAGMTGSRGAHVRHFVAPNPEDQDLFYRKLALSNPSRNAYEFGLG